MAKRPLRWGRIAATLATLSITIAASPALPADMASDVLDVPVGGEIDGFLDGHLARMFVGNYGLEQPYITPTFPLLGDRLRQPSFCRFDLGRKEVPGDGVKVTLNIGGQNNNTTGCVAKEAFKTGFDAVVGVDAVPQERVIFHLRKSQDGEQSFSYPTGLMHYRSGPIVRVDGHLMNLYFYTNWSDTVITAHVAKILAEDGKAYLQGPVEYHDLGFDVPRPMRRMVFREPLQFGPITIRDALVTTSDFGDVNGVEDEDLIDAKRGEQIIVQAKQPRQDPWIDRIRLGSRDLSPCSTIEFDKRHKVVTLSCLPPMPTGGDQGGITPR